MRIRAASHSTHPASWTQQQQQQQQRNLQEEEEEEQEQKSYAVKCQYSHCRYATWPKGARLYEIQRNFVYIIKFGIVSVQSAGRQSRHKMTQIVRVPGHEFNNSRTG